MQFLWKYIDDLIGKGLEWSIVLELLWYSTITLVPIALPLAILLASMMLIGGFSERSELTAINSLGQPFTYVMYPLLLFTFCITILSFITSNYIIPYANLKATTLMYDIMQKKLSINIQEKVFFTDIDGYSIRVEKKSDNDFMEDVLIYDYSQNKKIKKIFNAKKALMSTTNDNKFLIIKLYDGYHYNDVTQKEQRYTLNTQFHEYHLKLDLSSFQMERSTSDRFSNRAKTMHIKQLKQHIDSLQTVIADVMHTSSSSTLKHMRSIQLLQKNEKNINSEIQKTINSYNNYINQKKTIKSKLNKFQVELHRKFTLALACILMLIIGAPIGAIIKKGGFGLPVIFSILLFLIYHILSITGEKMVKKDVINPIIGMWTPTWIMLIIGIILIIIVNNNVSKIWSKN